LTEEGKNERRIGPTAPAGVVDRERGLKNLSGTPKGRKEKDPDFEREEKKMV